MRALARLAFGMSLLAVPLALALSSILALAAPVASAALPLLAVALTTSGTFLWMRGASRAEEAREARDYRYVTQPAGARWDQSGHFS